MFWTASLPRKWSIRKICESSNAPCSVSFSSTADSVVVTERLLEDDPGGGPVQADLLERPDDRLEGRRRHRQIVQQPGVGAELLPGPLDPLAERRRSGADRHVGEPVGERLPGLIGDLGAAELVDRLVHMVDEPGVVPVVGRGADDLVARRQQTGALEVEEPGQQLAGREVAGPAEEDDDMRVGNGGTGHGAGRGQGGRRRRAQAPASPSPPLAAGFSSWPPNCLRIAERILLANSSSSREANRS